MKILMIGGTLLALACFMIACTQTASTDSNNGNETANTMPSPEATRDELAVGRSNFKEQCARCHKDDGTGGKVEIEGVILKAENLASERMAKDPDEEYIEYMTDGIPDEGMPSFKDVLSKNEMEGIVKFIRKEIQK